jgi:hypothetical protein
MFPSDIEVVKEILAVLDSPLNDMEKLTRCAVIYLRSMAKETLTALTPPPPP